MPVQSLLKWTNSKLLINCLFNRIVIHSSPSILNIQAAVDKNGLLWVIVDLLFISLFPLTISFNLIRCSLMPIYNDDGRRIYIASTMSHFLLNFLSHLHIIWIEVCIHYPGFSFGHCWTTEQTLVNSTSYGWCDVMLMLTMMT